MYLSVITVWKFAGYATDRTAQNTAVDILTSMPKESVVLIDRDTMLFTSQYVRYVENVRPDVALIHGNRIGNSDYQRTLTHLFPALVVDSVRDATTAAQFMTSIARDGRLFSYTKYPVPDGWYWVPYGLVYKLMNANQLSDQTGIIDENSKIWDSFHNPSAGILSHYKHLLLSDVLDVYTTMRVNFGKSLYRTGWYEKARDQLIKAVAYGGDSDLSEGYMYLGLSEFQLKQCNVALSYFDRAEETKLLPNNDITYYKGITYRDCVGDTVRAREYFDAYAEENGKSQTLLEKL
jgi:tetratricopeptide (TPR) repeat protein